MTHEYFRNETIENLEFYRNLITRNRSDVCTVQPGANKCVKML